MAKSTRTKSMILYIEDNDEEQFSKNNGKRDNPELAYSEEILKALNFRFETPNSKNRWDSPMETISNLNYENFGENFAEDLIQKLSRHFTGQAGSQKVKPNNSTQA